MSRRVPGALRYCLLEDWDCPTALYLVEKRTAGPPATWLIARPALIAEQEHENVQPVPIAEADGEEIVYEEVLLVGDQPGVLPKACRGSVLRSQLFACSSSSCLRAPVHFGPCAPAAAALGRVAKACSRCVLGVEIFARRRVDGVASMASGATQTPSPRP